jgi:hypothetical protein
VDSEVEGTDEVIQRQGWEQKPDGGWSYVGGESGAALARKKRVKQIAKLMGISFQAASEYCESLDAS